MLLAVEGGGFFSSLASGYSAGLTLLLLGRKSEERPMRVLPWNQYELVDQELDPDVQLASRKNRLSRGCAFFVCFGRASAGLDGPCPPKVGPVHQSDSLPDASASDKEKICNTNDADDGNARNVYLKSSLKKTRADCSSVVCEDSDVSQPMNEVGTDATGCRERRKVQWTDACGRDLAEIREFELSDNGSSDGDFEREGDRRCECAIQ